MNLDILVFLAVAASLITFAVVHRIFRDQFKIGPPTLLAGVVSGLAFIGLISHGRDLLAALLLPYEALALLVLLSVLLVIASGAVKLFQKPRRPGTELPARDAQTGSKWVNPERQQGPRAEIMNKVQEQYWPPPKKRLSPGERGSKGGRTSDA